MGLIWLGIDMPLLVDLCRVLSTPELIYVPKKAKRSSHPWRLQTSRSSSSITDHKKINIPILDIVTPLLRKDPLFINTTINNKIRTEDNTRWRTQIGDSQGSLPQSSTRQHKTRAYLPIIHQLMETTDTTTLPISTYKIVQPLRMNDKYNKRLFLNTFLELF